MKKFRYFLLIVLVLPLCLVFSGCGKVVVDEISKTGSDKDSDYYTVYYSDGSTSVFDVEKAEVIEKLNIEELFRVCVEQGLYNENEFDKFLIDYVQNRVDKSLNFYPALNSVVSVCARFGQTLSGGAGVIYQMDSQNSYIVTNCHVVSSYTQTSMFKSELTISSQIRVWLYGDNDFVNFSNSETNSNFSKGIETKCVGYSEEYDLAVLKVPTDNLKSFNENACATKIASSYSIAEKVYAIGNPEGEGISVTSGVVSVLSENIVVSNDNGAQLPHRCLRIDSAIYGGNSGGGLFNEDGELIGIVNASSKNADNYNFALPIDNVKQVVRKLIANANATKPYVLTHYTMADLGATVEEEFENFNTVTGELCYSVSVASINSGVLYNAGLRQGDVITSVVIEGDEYEITRSFQLDDFLINLELYPSITFNIRGKQPVTLTPSQI